MYKPLKGLLVCLILLGALTLSARLPLPETGFTIAIAGVLIALAVTIEWPRWVHSAGSRWPNKLGQ